MFPEIITTMMSKLALELGVFPITYIVYAEIKLLDC